MRTAGHLYQMFVIAICPVLIGCCNERGPSSNGSLRPNAQGSKYEVDEEISEKDAIRVAEASLREKGMLYDNYEVWTSRVDKDEWRITISAVPPGFGMFKGDDYQARGKNCNH